MPPGVADDMYQGMDKCFMYPKFAPLSVEVVPQTMTLSDKTFRRVTVTDAVKDALTEDDTKYDLPSLGHCLEEAIEAGEWGLNCYMGG